MKKQCVPNIQKGDFYIQAGTSSDKEANDKIFALDNTEKTCCQKKIIVEKSYASKC